MSKQDQRMEGDGSAFQAGRDMVVHQGLTPAQMSEIMIALVSQVQSFAAKAEQTVIERCAQMRESILAEFAKPDMQGRSEAFSDPDFQFAVRSAHEGFSRSGDSELEKQLVRMLAERAAEPVGSRRSKALNEAIDLAANLSTQEFALLAAIFLLKRCQVKETTYERLIEKFEHYLSPFVKDFPEDQHCIEYLESMRCVSLNELTRTPIWEILQRQYGGLFSAGFSPAEFESAIPDPLLRNLIEVHVVHRKSADSADEFRTYFRALSRNALEEELKASDVGLAGIQEVMMFFDSKIYDVHVIEGLIRAGSPSLSKIADCWVRSRADRAIPTSLGVILAHSAMVGRAGLIVSLDVWVK